MKGFICPGLPFYHYFGSFMYWDLLTLVFWLLLENFSIFYALKPKQISKMLFCKDMKEKVGKKVVNINIKNSKA